MSGRQLRAAMATGLVEAPGCFDALSATLVERAGFPAAYLSGFAVSGASLGAPDLGLLGLDDVTSVLRRIRACVAIPVIVDIDTGFGGPLNVRRTVHEVEAAGAAAVQIEDQAAPKRCGHFEDKRIVDLDEALERVAVAVEARRSPDTVVVARTDAVAVAGVDAAIERARRFAAVGADVVFVEAIESAEQLADVARALPDVPLLYNAVEGGRSPLLPHDVLERAGVRILIHPITLLLETIRAQQAALAALAAERPATEATIRLARDVVGADEAMRFRPGPATPPA